MNNLRRDLEGIRTQLERLPGIERQLFLIVNIIIELSFRLEHGPLADAAAAPVPDLGRIRRRRHRRARRRQERLPFARSARRRLVSFYDISLSSDRSLIPSTHFKSVYQLETRENA